MIIDAKLLGGDKIFKLAWGNGISGIRAGSVRIFTYIFIIQWAYFYLLSSIRFETDKFKRIIYILFWLIILYQFIFCNMTRQLLLMVFLTTIIFFCRLENRTKLFVLLAVSLVFSAVLLITLNKNNLKLNGTVFGKLVSLTQNEVSDKEHGNIAIRVNGIKFYYPYFQETKFLGMGMMSTTFQGSPVHKGELRKYQFADIGFFAILFRFGVFAIFFIIIVLVGLFKDLLFIQKNATDISSRINANGLTYFLIGTIIFVPSLSIFFEDINALYYGIIFYFVYKIKDSLEFPQ